MPGPVGVAYSASQATSWIWGEGMEQGEDRVGERKSIWGRGMMTQGEVRGHL